MSYYRETNSYFSHGAPGVSNAAGSAIWALDYTLFGATIGIKRFHFHEGVGYRYNMVNYYPTPQNSQPRC